MRHLRALRIGASDLAARSHHRKRLSHPGCKLCWNQLESVQHFLLECPNHDTQRRKLVSAVKLILKRLGTEPNAANLLGMLPLLSSRAKITTLTKIYFTKHAYLFIGDFRNRTLGFCCLVVLSIIFTYTTFLFHIVFLGIFHVL